MRSVVVRARDYKAVENGQRLELRSVGGRGLFNGDRVRIVLRDMCEHEGLPARVVGLQYETTRSGFVAINEIERDD